MGSGRRRQLNPVDNGAVIENILEERREDCNTAVEDIVR
jgi:hypothetical protein